MKKIVLLKNNSGKTTPRPEIVKLLHGVTQICNINGVTRVHRWN
ncbi:MAG: hypothetical protein ACJA2S_003267 [Cyclobacteriaceae bacterium]|jgi:hypothetical protein